MVANAAFGSSQVYGVSDGLWKSVAIQGKRRRWIRTPPPLRYLARISGVKATFQEEIIDRWSNRKRSASGADGRAVEAAVAVGSSPNQETAITDPVNQRSLAARQAGVVALSDVRSSRHGTPRRRAPGCRLEGGCRIYSPAETLVEESSTTRQIRKSYIMCFCFVRL